MDERRRFRGRGEAAATTLEHVGITVVVALLLAGVATGMGDHGGSLGARVGERIAALASGEGSTRRWRDARERRTGGGTEPVRVSRDELRLEPVVDPAALWHREWSDDRTLRGTRVQAHASACAVCASLEWSHDLGTGTRADGDGARTGLAAGVDGSIRLALAAAEATIQLDRTVGDARVTAKGRVRGAVGAEADATGELQLGASAITAQVDAGAMAGAIARAEGKVGVDLLGVAISQSGRAEGWAGAGLRGTAGVHHEAGAISWRFGWGGALGLGGAAEWSGQVDASRVPESHRRLARDALLGGLRVAGISVPYVHVPRRNP